MYRRLKAIGSKLPSSFPARNLKLSFRLVEFSGNKKDFSEDRIAQKEGATVGTLNRIGDD